MRMGSSTPALLALSLGYFALGTASLAVVGLSAPIGADLHVRPATVGLLVTVFALVFALAAPAAPIVLGRMRRKRTLLLGLTLMIAAATVFGVPLASSAGNVVGWRSRFLPGLGARPLSAVALLPLTLAVAAHAVSTHRGTRRKPRTEPPVLTHH
ncbi:hypothetical protein [Microtetraspora malaysiensis]|uniref:hypothetical protein n=1 Tax=Microtetraspora malaysiensis TaxID=161358 RepID=UPI003D8DC536